jgi:hypothetical protein
MTFRRRLHLSELIRTVQERRGGTQARNRYPLNEALLNKFLSLTTEYGAIPVVLFLPGRSDNAEDKERRGFLRRWAESKHVAFADLTESLHGEGVGRTYIKDNFHWNEYGHEVAAKAIHRLLATQVMGDKGASIDVASLPPPPWRAGHATFCNDRGDSSQTAVTP